MSETIDGLQKITDQISQQGERLGLVINSGKTKVMAISKEQQDLQISVKSTQSRSRSLFILVDRLHRMEDVNRTSKEELV